MGYKLPRGAYRTGDHKVRLGAEVVHGRLVAHVLLGRLGLDLHVLAVDSGLRSACVPLEGLRTLNRCECS